MVSADLNLHALTWTGNNTSADINNVLADEIVPVNGPDCMSLSIRSSKPFGGALASLNRPVPLINGQPMAYLKVQWGIRPSVRAVQMGRLYETDAIVVWPPAPNSSSTPVNWYDGSFQNVGGVVEIDKVASSTAGKVTYAWNPTGCNFGTLPPGVWNTITNIYLFDFTGKTTSVLSTQLNGNAPFLIPASMQKVSANISNWSMYVNNVPEPLVKFQAQLCVNSVPAFYEVDYTLSSWWSDNANFE